MPENYKISLSLEQLHIIGAALSEAPYRIAAPIIADLEGQIAAQQSAAPPIHTDGKGL